MKNRKFIAISFEVDDMICKIGMKTDSYSNTIKKLITYYNSNGKEAVDLKRNEKKFLGARFIFETINGKKAIAGWETVKLDRDTGKRYKIVKGKRMELEEHLNG